MSKRFMTMGGFRRAGRTVRQMAVNEHTGGRSTRWVSGQADDGGHRACMGPGERLQVRPSTSALLPCPIPDTAGWG